MAFAPVKTSPWGRPVKYRKAGNLWPESVWKRLVELAADEPFMGPLTFECIRRANAATIERRKKRNLA